MVLRAVGAAMFSSATYTVIKQLLDAEKRGLERPSYWITVLIAYAILNSGARKDPFWSSVFASFFLVPNLTVAAEAGVPLTAQILKYFGYMIQSV